MRKLLTSFLLTTFAVAMAANAFAQSESKKPPHTYINLGYAMQDIKIDGDKMPGYEWGAFAEFGTTFFLHRTPVANMIRFGLDFSFLDLQYANYKNNEMLDGLGYELVESHFANAGMQVGPSITVSPIKRLNLKAYMHYAPSYAMIAMNDWDDVAHGYAGYITGGIQASYSVLTVGFEARTGSCNFKNLDLSEEAIVNETIEAGTTKAKLPSMRFIVGFRF